MPFLVCAFLIPYLLFWPAPQSPATFPIPKNMQEIWPGAKLNDADMSLLRKAMASDLGEQSDESRPDRKYTFDKVNTADLDLGTLGNGVIALMSGATQCGTGGCPIYVYVRERAGYRKVLSSFGWAFAVVSSRTTVPDLAVASNGGGGRVGLTLYRYAGKIFTDQGCDILTSKDKDGKTPSSWWDPSQVRIEPCAQH